MLIIIVDAFVQKVECFAKIKMPMRKTEEKNRRKTLLLLKISSSSSIRHPSFKVETRTEGASTCTTHEEEEEEEEEEDIV